ncbi:MAG: hypothetical protein Q9M13_08380, partial [Mariprofundales bacterium]|nr:hypothetical protein [Mariprofundales bacterium]
FAGKANLFGYKIDERYVHDKGLIAHERLHFLSGVYTLGIYWLLYKICPTFRYWAEVWCYRKQLSYIPEGRKSFYAALYADFIVVNYDLTFVNRDLTIQRIWV